MPFNPLVELSRSSGSSSHQLTLVESFKRSIKRDSIQFKKFKEDKNWDTWQRSSLTAPRAQDVYKVLDPDYKILTQEYMSLFNEKHKFMYSLFSIILQTDRGKNFVREHEDDFYGQTFYKKLYGFYTTSAGSRVSTS